MEDECSSYRTAHGVLALMIESLYTWHMSKRLVSQTLYTILEDNIKDPLVDIEVGTASLRNI
jgi:hypothetical protein